MDQSSLARAIVAPHASSRIFKTLERFLHVEAASGVVLLLAAAVALIWANSPWAESYERLWHARLSFGIGGFEFARSLHFSINEGLMTIFFLVVGLEIRRELHEGALAGWRLAALPLAAAVGGVIAPALIYLALNQGPEVREGWAIPTATDIAFAVGVLTLLGRRVPSSLRVLLLALAIVDDIAAILIIALFYSEGIQAGGLVIAAAGLAGVFVFQRIGVRSALPYVIPGSIVWAGLLVAGIHPTIAGVILGLMTPVTGTFGHEAPLEAATRALDDFRERLLKRDTNQLVSPVRQLKSAERELLPPAMRVQTTLHPWVAYLIMPLFALANAGVHMEGLNFGNPATLGIVSGITAGLVLGKPIGIVLTTLLAVRLGLCALPDSVTWRGILLIGCLGGIGFTMSIFIATLAFPGEALLGSAKFAILIGSSIAAVAGLMFGRFAYRNA